MTDELTHQTDPQLRKTAFEFFGVPFVESALHNNDGNRGVGIGSCTVKRGERFTFVNVLKGESRKQWW